MNGCIIGEHPNLAAPERWGAFTPGASSDGAATAETIAAHDHSALGFGHFDAEIDDGRAPRPLGVRARACHRPFRARPAGSSQRAPDLLRQLRQRRPRGMGRAAFQRRLPARRAGAEVLPRHQRIATRGDGLGPVAGGAGVGGSGWGNSHNGIWGSEKLHLVMSNHICIWLAGMRVNFSGLVIPCRQVELTGRVDMSLRFLQLSEDV